MPAQYSKEQNEEIFNNIISDDFRRATFSGTQRGVQRVPWSRVTIRPIDLRGERCLQFSYFDGKRTATHNDQKERRIRELIYTVFSGVHISTATQEIDIRTTKKGVVTVGVSKAVEVNQELDTKHNRTKEYLLPEGECHEILEVMGISTTNGMIKPTMRAKFIQINEFIKQVKICIDDVLPGNEPISILDCGCGSSYLTLATHYYFNTIVGRPTKILGVDVNKELIRASIAKAEHLSASELNFQTGKIGQIQAKPDIVLALHACDTATDDAIAQAIFSKAKVFLGVPCCHRAINREIRNPQPDQPFQQSLGPILEHGILRERLADLATDAFRAATLKMHGYKTDVFEFVAPEFTAKNLMIRAVQKGARTTVQPEYESLKTFFGVTPEIEKRLNSHGV